MSSNRGNKRHIIDLSLGDSSDDMQEVNEADSRTSKPAVLLSGTSSEVGFRVNGSPEVLERRRANNNEQECMKTWDIIKPIGSPCAATNPGSSQLTALPPSDALGTRDASVLPSSRLLNTSSNFGRSAPASGIDSRLIDLSFISNRSFSDHDSSPTPRRVRQRTLPSPEFEVLEISSESETVSPQPRMFAPVRTSAAHNASSTAVDAQTSASSANTERLLTESHVADKTHMEVLPNEQDEREAATTMLALSKHKIDDPPAASSSSAPPPPKKKTRVKPATATAAAPASASASAAASASASASAPASAAAPASATVTASSSLWGKAGDALIAAHKAYLIRQLKESKPWYPWVWPSLEVLEWKVVYFDGVGYLVTPPAYAKLRGDTAEARRAFKLKTVLEKGLVENKDYFVDHEDGREQLFAFLRSNLHM